MFVNIVQKKIDYDGTEQGIYHGPEINAITDTFDKLIEAYGDQIPNSSTDQLAAAIGASQHDTVMRGVVDTTVSPNVITISNALSDYIKLEVDDVGFVFTVDKESTDAVTIKIGNTPELEAISEGVALPSAFFKPDKIYTATKSGGKFHIAKGGEEPDLSAYALQADVDADVAAINTALGDKVDVEDGKGLSTNDFTDADKTKLDGLENFDASDVFMKDGSVAATGDFDLDNNAIKNIANGTDDGDAVNLGQLNTGLDGKVDVVAGKGLSANDFTDGDKTKLDGLENYDDSGVFMKDGSRPATADFDMDNHGLKDISYISPNGVTDKSLKYDSASGRWYVGGTYSDDTKLILLEDLDGLGGGIADPTVPSGTMLAHNGEGDADSVYWPKNGYTGFRGLITSFPGTFIKKSSTNLNLDSGDFIEVQKDGAYLVIASFSIKDSSYNGIPALKYTHGVGESSSVLITYVTQIGDYSTTMVNTGIVTLTAGDCFCYYGYSDYAYMWEGGTFVAVIYLGEE